MPVTFENLTLYASQTEPPLELAARRDVLDRPRKTSRGLRQVERTRGQNATPSATAPPHFVLCGISPSYLDSLEILPWPSPRYALLLDRWKSKRRRSTRVREQEAVKHAHLP